MSAERAWPAKLGISFICAALLFAAGCSQPAPGYKTIGSAGINPDLHAMAIREVRTLQSNGKRVWCVPFARNASGVNIRGNANTWWDQAEGVYGRGNQPAVGAVMAFRATRSNPMGHVAVVSQVVSPREIRVDHANWERNKISLQMSIVDVSSSNNWSDVRVESQPGSYGSVFPVAGFIYPKSFGRANDRKFAAPLFGFSETSAKP
jgi:hypothetical protein